MCFLNSNVCNLIWFIFQEIIFLKFSPLDNNFLKYEIVNAFKV